MIDLFMGAVEPPKNPLLIEPEPIVIEQPAPELTVEEKIASNYYNCDESIQWIRADNAECLTKGTRYRAPESGNATERTNTQLAPQNTATAPAGWFPKGQCTWLVWTKRPVGRWNDSSDWLWQAKRDGWATGSAPRAGAIAWRSGHVAYIQSVTGTTMVVSEANYDRKGSVRTIEVPVASYSAFIY